MLLSGLPGVQWIYFVVPELTPFHECTFLLRDGMSQYTSQADVMYHGSLCRFLNKYNSLTLYAPCIILQYVCIYKPTRCINSCDQTLFSIRCSTCFGLYQSIFRATFISCTSHLVYAGTICLAVVWLQEESLNKCPCNSVHAYVHASLCTCLR